MKINASRKLIVEDFPDQKDWIGRAFSVINDFFQKTLASVDGGLEFGSNILGKEHTFDFLYVSHAASLPLNVRWPFAKRPMSVQLISAYLGNWTGAWPGASIISNDSLVPFIGQIAWEFTQDGEVSITDFCRIKGDETTVRAPLSGQRVVLTIRMSP